MLVGWAPDSYQHVGDIHPCLCFALRFCAGPEMQHHMGHQRHQLPYWKAEGRFGGLGRVIRQRMTKGAQLTGGYLFAYSRTTHHQNAAAAAMWVNTLKNLLDFSQCSQLACSCRDFSLAGDQLPMSLGPICKYSPKKGSQDTVYNLKKNNTTYLTF